MATTAIRPTFTRRLLDFFTRAGTRTELALDLTPADVTDQLARGLGLSGSAGHHAARTDPSLPGVVTGPPVPPTVPPTAPENRARAAAEVPR
jgi:hypothetical protein